MLKRQLGRRVFESGMPQIWPLSPSSLNCRFMVAQIRFRVNLLLLQVHGVDGNSMMSCVCIAATELSVIVGGETKQMMRNLCFARLRVCDVLSGRNKKHAMETVCSGAPRADIQEPAADAKKRCNVRVGHASSAKEIWRCIPFMWSTDTHRARLRPAGSIKNVPLRFGAFIGTVFVQTNTMAIDYKK